MRCHLMQFHLLTHAFQSIICKCNFHEYFMSFETWISQFMYYAHRLFMEFKFFLVCISISKQPNSRAAIVTMHASGKYFARSVYKNFHVLFKALEWLLTMLHKLGSPCCCYVQKKIFYRNKKINHCKKIKFSINDFFSKCN